MKIPLHLFRPLERVTWQETAGLMLVAVLFLATSFASERLTELIERLVGEGGRSGMAIYIVTMVIDILIPFASTLPFIPIAVSLWGQAIAAVLTVTGWLTGACIAFTLARRWGRPLLERFTLMSRIKQFSEMVPHKNMVTGIVFLGLVGAPIDFVSYALGLFTPIRLWAFVGALFLGLAPFGIFITYTATLPFVYQTYIVGFMVIAWLFVYGYFKQNQDGGNIYRPGR